MNEDRQRDRKPSWLPNYHALRHGCGRGDPSPGTSLNRLRTRWPSSTSRVSAARNVARPVRGARRPDAPPAQPRRGRWTP